jgi:uncharacterized protein YgiM (DUF1202 family)
MPIATIVADKAKLRAGPGSEHSEIMSVTKGTRLAVETKKGQWYRVMAPTGQRAWISGDVISFGPDAYSRSGRVLQIDPVP